MWILGLKGLKSNMATTTTTKMGLNCKSNEEKCKYNILIKTNKDMVSSTVQQPGLCDVALPKIYDSPGNKSANIIKMFAVSILKPELHLLLTHLI